MQSRELKERELAIARISDELTKLTSELTRKQNENSILKKSVENLREQIGEMNEMRKKMKMFEASVREKTDETVAFQVSH